LTKKRKRLILKQKRETQQVHILKPESLALIPAMTKISDDGLSPYPRAPCINLSGNLRSTTRNLFLLPDGSGAASSYVPIPELDEKTAVFALNCHFMRTPELFTIGLPKATQIYIAITPWTVPPRWVVGRRRRCVRDDTPTDRPRSDSR
jgi:hypothetical protein